MNKWLFNYIIKQRKLTSTDNVLVNFYYFKYINNYKIINIRKELKNETESNNIKN